MKYIMIALLGLFAITSTFADNERTPIPNTKDGFNIRRYQNIQSGLTEYYFERSWDGQYDLLPITYQVTDEVKKYNDNTHTPISTCILHHTLNWRLVYGKITNPKDKNTHAIYLYKIEKKKNTCEIMHVVSFIPDVGNTKEVVKTVYVTNTVSAVTGEATPQSDGKYEEINFNFHK